MGKRVNGRSVLVVFDAEAALAIPFDRSLESGEVLDFDVVEGEGFPFTFRDRQTGSEWNLNGVAIAGPLAGEHLDPIATFTAFWFAWASFNPETEIHSVGTN